VVDPVRIHLPGEPHEFGEWFALPDKPRHEKRRCNVCGFFEGRKNNSIPPGLPGKAPSWVELKTCPANPDGERLHRFGEFVDDPENGLRAAQITGGASK
jgi:hypothetical protein